MKEGRKKESKKRRKGKR